MDISILKPSWINSLSKTIQLNRFVKTVLNVHLTEEQYDRLNFLWTYKSAPLLTAVDHEDILHIYLLCVMLIRDNVQIFLASPTRKKSHDIFDNLIYLTQTDTFDNIDITTNKQPSKMTIKIFDNTLITKPIRDGAYIRGIRNDYVILNNMGNIDIDVYDIILQTLTSHHLV